MDIDWQFVCQMLLALMVSVNFLKMAETDFHGVESRPPGGFGGFIGTLIAAAIAVTILYGAGAFSQLFGGKP